LKTIEFSQLKQVILERLKNELPAALTYHSVEHTIEVLDACNVAITRLELDEHEALLVRTAALLHDIGYIWGHNEHEARSVEFAKQELPSYGYSENEIEIIGGIIMSTKVPQSAETILQKILCDADLMYLGTDSFESRGNDLFQEFLANGVVANKQEWDELQIQFMQRHKFHTDYAVIHFGPGKAKNLETLMKKNVP
jgi:predicted metal-dependent HD superfamily phosphohydrolase